MTHTIHQEASYASHFVEKRQKDKKLESSSRRQEALKWGVRSRLPTTPAQSILHNLRLCKAVSGCSGDSHKHHSGSSYERLSVMKISNNVRLVRHIWDGTETIK